MIVKPTLQDHPKFLRLHRKLGPDALYVLLRMWAHCETDQKGERWRGADPEYIEAVCRWSGDAGRAFAALLECEFVAVVEGGLIIRNWKKYNQTLVNSWDNGRSGGRPRKTHGKPMGNPRVSGMHSSGNPRVSPSATSQNPPVTHGEPVGPPRREEKSREEKNGEEYPQTPTSGPAKSDPVNGEVGWPTREQWVAACERQGVPEHVAQEEWLRQESKPEHERWARVSLDRLPYHAERVLGWWRQKGCPGPGGPGGGEVKVTPYNLRMQIDALVAELPNHKGNPDGVWPPAVRETHYEDFIGKTRRLRELREELANLGQ